MENLKQKIVALCGWCFPWEFTDDEIMDMTQGKTKGELLNWLSSLTAIRDGLENWEDWIDC